MDTEKIYEELMLGKYYNEIKYVRNCWNKYTNTNSAYVPPYIDIGGDNHNQYQFIMKRIDDIVFKMICQVAYELLKIYKIPINLYDLRTSKAITYYLGKENALQGYFDQPEEISVLAFSRNDQYAGNLFVFKKFGIDHQLPKNTLEELLKRAHLERVMYISCVENNAKNEVVNQEVINQLDSAIFIFSLKEFIEDFFGKDEFLKFKHYSDVFKKKVDDYLGFALVRTLKPNAILNFKKYILEQILNMNVCDMGLPEDFDSNQKAILDNGFFTERNYELLLGSSDFAQSYLTAEWLFYSLRNAGNIDLTAIEMGYFKSIEQLLFNYIRLHTYENDRDHYRRKIQTSMGLKDLTIDLVTNFPKTIMLKGLTQFFGFYKTTENEQYYLKFNQDLKRSGITNQTFEFMIDTLTKIPGLRNGDFHKDNLTDWGKVIAARKIAHLVYYFVFGGLKISNRDKVNLGLIEVNDNHDDYYKLCEYINQKAYENKMFSFPIYFIDAWQSPNEIILAHPDDYIKYDNHGNPTYSGVYFKLGNMIKCITKEKLPNEIWEGELVIKKTSTIQIEPSGPQTLIFKDGRFLVDET